VLTNEPDYSDYQDPEYDWSSSVYGDVKEIIPTDTLEPEGKYVTLSHYFDANLYHDMVTGRSVTAILHFLNQTLMDWYSKKQATVETATFGSEFITARTTIDQIVDLQMTLCYLGIPIQEKSYVFRDNKTVIDASLTPHAKLHKRHNALSFHRVQEAVASKYFTIFHLPGKYNPANILRTIPNKIFSWWYGGMVAPDSTFHRATVLPSLLAKTLWWSGDMEDFIMINIVLIQT
jgi:hypothetical protein